MKDSVSIVERKLARDQKHFTLNEAAAATGLSVDEAREALDTLIRKYICRLQVTENGDLIYDFGHSLRRRDRKSLAEQAKQVVDFLWKVFTWIFKVWITVTLVVYFVIFLVLLVVLVLGSGSKKGKGGPGKAMLNLDGLARIFYSIFRWQTVTGSIGYDTDRRGYPYRKYQPKPAVLNQKKKSFIASVFDFVFGPKRVPIDPLTNQKEVAAYLIEQKGIVVPAELTALAGWNQAQAETFLTDCLVRFQGEVKVSANGAIYGRFDDILRGLGKLQGGKIVHYWDEYEPVHQLTGNSGNANLLVFGMNGFNLLFSFYMLAAVLPELANPETSNSIVMFLQNFVTADVQVIHFFLGWVPLIFSLLFFGIPLARWFKISRANRVRYHNNRRKRILKAIYLKQGRAQTLEEIVQAVNLNAKEETLKPAVVQKMLKDLVLDLGGETEASADGKIRYLFPKITLELNEVLALRSERQSTTTFGAIAIESE